MLTAILSLIGLGTAGAGIAAFAFPPFGAILLGLGKGLFGYLKQIPWYVFAALAILALIVGLYLRCNHWADQARADDAKLAELCQVVRIADHNPRLGCDQMGAQVTLMGQALENVTAALNKQTAAVRALATQTATERTAATKAEKAASGRASAAEAVGQRLAASAAQGPSSAAAGACQPSKALQEQWK